MINIKADSRKIKPGDIFIALRGISSDGHEYIDKAIENGAKKIIVEEPGDYGVETIIVSDTRKYLNKYLKENYNKYLDEMTIIGITGTNGKTTSAYLTYEALNKLGRKCAYIGTIGYYLDELVYQLPNTNPDICEMYEMLINAYDHGFKTVVLEASSQGISYGRIANIPFDYTVFTNLTRDHLDFHKTMDNYCQAKQQLFYQLKDNGLGIVNIDDTYCDNFKINKYKTYGFNNSDYQVTNINLTSNGMSFKVNNKLIEAKLLGKYNVYNVLVAYILLIELGYKYGQIYEILKDVNSPRGRMELIGYKNNVIIVDYAHTPDAMENVFNTVKEINFNHIYVVFGCTGDRDRIKRPIMMSLALSSADYVFVTSDDLHNEDFNQIVNDMLKNATNKNYTIIKNRAYAVETAFNKLDTNDLLLILGKGHEEYIIIKDDKIPYNDMEEVKKIIANKEKISN